MRYYLTPAQHPSTRGHDRPKQPVTLSEIRKHTAVPLKTVIVKAEGGDYPGLARNEFFCMSVAREAGFDVPQFWLSDDGMLLILSRFDRTQDGTPLGFEDMAVLTGRSVEWTSPAFIAV